MDEKLIRRTSGLMVLFDDVINVGHGGTDEERKDEGCGESGGRVKYWRQWRERTDNVVVASPKVDVDGIEHSEQGKAPGNSVDDDAFSVGEELVDDGAQEEQVY